MTRFQANIYQPAVTSAVGACLCCFYCHTILCGGIIPHTHLHSFVRRSNLGMMIFVYIFDGIAVRAAIFGVLWVLLGKRVWFFPNINAEETTFRELVRFWPVKDEGEQPKWTSRLFYATVALLVILLLRHHAPDEAARAR